MVWKFIFQLTKSVHDLLFDELSLVGYILNVWILVKLEELLFLEELEGDLFAYEITKMKNFVLFYFGPFHNFKILIWKGILLLLNIRLSKLISCFWCILRP